MTTTGIDFEITAAMCGVRFDTRHHSGTYEQQWQRTRLW
jgi:hypothetical protein